MGEPGLHGVFHTVHSGVFHTVHKIYSGRFLKDEEDFATGAKIAQIFSAGMFSVLVLYLMNSNSTKLSYIQRASLEKRLAVCCNLNTMVAATSAFLNFFQITEVDNWALGGQRNMVVDVARPIEWLLTCPLMQLALVLMGGSRIPEWRRIAMPLSSAVVLTCGTLTLFFEEPMTYLFYGFGACTHCTAMYFNRKQILEHSNGNEGLLSGDSEFRKATIILMCTWFPFPIWYMLSPEGVGAIDNILIIQMGWACLNIVSKFSMIFYIQRVKDNYYNRLKVKRAIKGAIKGYGEDHGAGDDVDSLRQNGELGSCVVETMQFLGMAENIERFLKLLHEAHIDTFDKLQTLDRNDCTRLQLPHDLVSALQKRHKVWKLEMVDDAEQELDAGEKHYNIIPVKQHSEHAPSGLGAPSDVANIAELMSQAAGEGTDGEGAFAGGGVMVSADMEKKLQEMEERLLGEFRFVMQGVQEKVQVSHDKLQLGIESVAKQSTESTQKLEKETQMAILGVGSQCQAMEQKLETAVLNMGVQNQSLHDVTGTRFERAIDKTQTTLEGKIELEFAKGPFARMTEQIIQESKAATFTTNMKMDAADAAQTARREAFEQRILAAVTDLVQGSILEVHKVVSQHSQTCVESMQQNCDSLQTTFRDDQYKLDNHIGQLSKDVALATSKNVEVAMGIFGNSLRAQLDSTQLAIQGKLENMESRTLEQRMETETNIFNKFNGLMNQFQQQNMTEAGKMSAAMEASVKQSTERVSRCEGDNLKDFRKFMEGAIQHHNDRFQDIYSMMSTVLEQSCGAKTKADECQQALVHLNERLICQDAGPFPGMHPGTFGQASNMTMTMPASVPIERFSQRSSAPSTRPSTASQSRDNAGNKSKMPTKYSQYGLQMMLDHGNTGNGGNGMGNMQM